MYMSQDIEALAKWLNDNQGVISVAIFIVTIFYGWLSGTFSALKKNPKLKFRLLEGPTFVCTFGTGKTHENFDVHRTGVALYLRITNIGASPASVEEIHVGYKWSILPFSRLWWRYRVGWFWLKHQAVTISDFQTKIGENTKFYPFMTQISTISGTSANTYLEIGQSTNGVVYFEQNDSFGGCFPLAHKKQVRLKIKIIDSFGSSYVKKFDIPRYKLSDAWKFNPSFGSTLASLRNEEIFVDLPTDEHGNLVPKNASAK